MPELVTIPISIFEVVVSYARPDFRMWLDRASIVQVVFDALEPWSPQIDNVEVIATGKPSEQGITIKLPLKLVSFFVGPSSCKFIRENADWSSAEETLAILDAAVSALVRNSGIAVGMRNAAVSLHMQPRSVPFTALLRPLLLPQLVSLDPASPSTMAVVARWPQRAVTIDGSAVVANAIFIRFEREFPSGCTSELMADQIRKDQDELFKILDVEEALV